jgi:heme-degrading monooxygenase HmoA
MAYVMMSWGKLRKGAWDQYEKHFKDEVAPTIDTIKGLQWRGILPNTEDPDEGISISLWETLEDLQNYERSEQRRALINSVEHVFTGEYWIKQFELVCVATSE